MEEVLVLQKRIAQIQNDKTQAQCQLAEATNKLDTIQKQLSAVNHRHCTVAVTNPQPLQVKLVGRGVFLVVSRASFSSLLLRNI